MVRSVGSVPGRSSVRDSACYDFGKLGARHRPVRPGGSERPTGGERYESVVVCRRVGRESREGGVRREQLEERVVRAGAGGVQWVEKKEASQWRRGREEGAELVRGEG